MGGRDNLAVDVVGARVLGYGIDNGASEPTAGCLDGGPGQVTQPKRARSAAVELKM